MLKISENNKIAISALSVFIVSFSLMLVFLGDSTNPEGTVKTDVLGLGAGSHQEEVAETDPEADYRTFLENYADPIFVVNTDGVFEFASESFCQLLGKDCEDLIGSKFVDYVNAKDHADLVAIYTKLVQDEEKMDAIGPFRMSDGKKEKLILFSAKSKVGRKEDKVVQIIFIARDLTPQVDELQKGESGAGGDGSGDGLDGGSGDGLDGGSGDGLDGGSGDGDSSDSLLDRLYPKIKEMRDEDGRLMVDKVTYKEE